MLKLKFQYSDHLIQRADSLEKTLMLGKTEAGGEEGNRGRDVDGLTDYSMDMSLSLVNMSLSKLREMLKDREAWGAVVHEIARGRT